MSAAPAFSSSILVLSSDALRRQLICVILKRRGATVAQASTLEETRGNLRLAEPDVLLVDTPSLDLSDAAEAELSLAPPGSCRLLLIDRPGSDRPALERLRSLAAAVLSPSLDDEELTGALKLLAGEPRGRVRRKTETTSLGAAGSP